MPCFSFTQTTMKTKQVVTKGTPSALIYLLEIHGFVFSKREPLGEKKSSNTPTKIKAKDQKLTQKENPKNYDEYHVKVSTEETPKIEKNKKARTAAKRSSVGLRGKRVSEVLNGMCRKIDSYLTPL
jgi:hypothetical protein